MDPAGRAVYMYTGPPWRIQERTQKAQDATLNEIKYETVAIRTGVFFFQPRRTPYERPEELSLEKSHCEFPNFE